MLTPEQFEQLLSDALDQPQRADLSEQISREIMQRPQLARVFRDWSKLDAALKNDPVPANVDWTQLRYRISLNAVEAVAVGGADPANAEFDAALRSNTAVNGSVDWPRLRSRLAVTVAGLYSARAGRPAQSASSRLRRWSTVGIAAAAVIVLTISWPRIFRNSPVPPGGEGLDDRGVTIVQSPVIQPDALVSAQVRSAAVSALAVSPTRIVASVVRQAEPDLPLETTTEETPSNGPEVFAMVTYDETDAALLDEPVFGVQ